MRPFLKPNQLIGFIICGFFIILINACSTVKQTVIPQQINPDSIEPKISFVETTEIKVTPKKLNQVPVGKVIASYQNLLNRGNSQIRKEALLYLANISMQLSEAKINSDIGANNNDSLALKNASFEQAIGYYQTLLNEYPQLSEKAQIQYQLARAHSLNASPESALKILDAIAVEHVESNSYVESQFRRGESYFVRKQYAVAEKAYTEVINAGDTSDYFDKALYKRGWSLFKQSLFLEAQSDFFLLYERINTHIDKNINPSDTSNFENDLLADTSRVISLAFYNMDGAESVEQYFKLHPNQNKSYQNKIYQSLSNLYIEQERYQDAANSYLTFIKNNPLSLSAPEFHSEVIAIYKKGGFPSLILPAKENFVVNYGRQSLFWQTYNVKTLDAKDIDPSTEYDIASQNIDTEVVNQAAETNQSATLTSQQKIVKDSTVEDSSIKDPTIIEKLLPILKTHLEDISTFYHAKAQKSNLPQDYLIAAKWYQEILATFNDLSVDSKFRFLLAETFEGGNQFEKAAKQYEIVAYTNPASEFSRDAGYRALVAYQNVKYPANASLLEKTLPQIQSGLKFTKSFETDAKAIDILARVSEQQLIIKDVQSAVDSSRYLLSLIAKQAKGQNSNNLTKHSDRAKIIIANGLFDLKLYQQAEVAISDLLNTTSLDKQQKAQFKRRRSEALYQLAEEAKLAYKTNEAIALYLSVKDYEPNSDIAIKAHFDAATLMLQAKMWQPSADLLTAFRKSYPKNKLTPSITEKLAFIYEQQQQWNLAAVEYQSLASTQDDPNLAREGYWQVAQLYLKAGNQQQAIDSFKNYAWTYPTPYLLAQEARYQLVNLYTQQKDQDKSNFWREKIVSFYHQNKQENNLRTASLAAESAFILSEDLFNNYQNIKLNLPLDKSLKLKRAAMKKALDAYNQIANYNVASYITASTHKVASIYQILSKDLMNSQRPKGLDADELEEYSYLLEDQALPFEDKAIEYYEINARRTIDKIYDASVKQSIDVLRKLKPAQYDKHEKLEDLNNAVF